MSDQPRAERILFGVSPRDGGAVDVILGVPTAAWEYMRDGHTHTLDLTKLGLPIRIVLFGASDQAQARIWIDEHNRTLGVTDTQDRSDEDFSIG